MKEKKEELSLIFFSSFIFKKKLQICVFEMEIKLDEESRNE